MLPSLFTISCLVGCEATAARRGCPPLGRLHFSLLPALAVTVLPKCPLCWMAWMGVGATLGLGRIGYQPWLLPAMAALLGIVLAVFAWRDWRRRQFATSTLLLLGGSLVIVGRLTFEHPPTLYAGLAVLFTVAIVRRRVQAQQ